MVHSISAAFYATTKRKVVGRVGLPFTSERTSEPSTFTSVGQSFTEFYWVFRPPMYSCATASLSSAPRRQSPERREAAERRMPGMPGMPDGARTSRRRATGADRRRRPVLRRAACDGGHGGGLGGGGDADSGRKAAGWSAGAGRDVTGPALTSLAAAGCESRGGRRRQPPLDFPRRRPFSRFSLAFSWGLFRLSSPSLKLKLRASFFLPFFFLQPVSTGFRLFSSES